MSELNLGNQISKYYKSFSGTDTLAFIMMPGCSPVVIGSLTTVSYSMYRNKKPVINIGRTNINGVTRGSRIFAGTMIFTLINQHWLKELQEQIDYIKNFPELKVDELPLFDVMIISANEYGNAVSMYIYGIDFTDEAQTISVEDLFTENTFSFVARDISNFHSVTYGKTPHGKSNKRNPLNDFTQKFYILNSSNISFDEIGKLEQQLSLAKLNAIKQEKRYTLTRELYFSSAKTMIGNDVAQIQEMLAKLKIDITINGVFDEAMDKAVRKYQSQINDDIDGIVDDKLYNYLLNNVTLDGHRLGIIINKYGAYVYKNMSLHSDIVDTKSYKTQITINEVDISTEDGYPQRWYKTSSGYVIEEDVYSSYYTGNVVEFPIVNFNDTGAYVTLIQSALSNVYPEFNLISGLYDYETEKKIKKLQQDNGLYPTGIVDNDTWILLQSLSGNVTTQISEDNFVIKHHILPGEYYISDANIIDKLNAFYSTASCKNSINIKVSTISYFDKNKYDVKTETITVKEIRQITLSSFKNAFVYSPKHRESPYRIDYIVYPYGKKAYKWTLYYK